MKKIILILSAVMIVFGLSGFKLLQDKDKKAILFVNFGTTFKDNRAITIDALKQKIADTYQGYDVKLAFTSRQVIRTIFKNEGIRIDTPEEALSKLKKDGYGTVIVQSTHIINGVEAEYLKNEVEDMKDDFHIIKLGDPLLTHVEDYKNTIKALKSQIETLKSDEAVVLIGHGTHHPITSTYAMMDYMLEADGFKNVYIGTVEGYPTYDNVVAKLKNNNIKKVTLMPLMFVAGDHAHNDIASDEDDSWKTMLKKEGLQVNTYIHGLGENKEIQKLFIEHIQHAIDKKEVDMKRKKAGYALDS